MSNQLTIFKDALDNYPQDANDFKIICTVAKAQYDVTVLLLDTLMLPQKLMRDGLESALQAMDSAAYSGITRALNGLNTAVKSVSPVIPSRIDPDVVRVANLLFTNCKELLSVLPEDMFNMLEDFNYGINSFINLNNSLIMLPTSLANMLASSLMKLKNQALRDLTGVMFDTVLSPIIMYEDFLKDNGINEMIRKMTIIENCMLNKQLCNRPRSEFIHGSDKVLNSVYFKREMLMDSQGNIRIDAAGTTSQQQSKFNNVMKSLRTFRSH